MYIHSGIYVRKYTFTGSTYAREAYCCCYKRLPTEGQTIHSTPHEQQQGIFSSEQHPQSDQLLSAEPKCVRVSASICALLLKSFTRIFRKSENVTESEILMTNTHTYTHIFILNCHWLCEDEFSRSDLYTYIYTECI